MKCPECDTDNPSDSKYCKECATPLPSSEEVPVSPTKTLEVPMKELEIGGTFSRKYKILDEIGKGGMGVVYKALDSEIKEDVAIKILKPEIAQDKSIIERFRNELKIARKISHKNVCRMYDLNKEEGTYYITMEYVPGEDLKDVIRRDETLSTEKAISIAKQVCEGLVEAHRLGVVHRDLKPQNIMIDAEGEAKVMDFGIARSVEAPGVTATGMIIGTPDYISPEQAEGEEADQRSDIYALGVILYEMVTGSVPFKGDTALSVALKHKTKIPLDPRKLNPRLSEDLSRLTLVCMEKDKERRYQTAEALLADLRNIEDDLPLGTKMRPRRETFVASLIRKKLFIPALVVALLIIALAVWQLLPHKETISSPMGKPSLAILYFKNSTGDDNLDIWKSALSDLLISDLSQSKHLDVLSTDKLFSILRKLNILDAKTYATEDLRALASQGGVTHILQGIIAKSGNTFRINTMIQDSSTMKIIGSDMVEGEGEKSFFPMVDELNRKIKANFNLSAEQIAGDIDVEAEKITTSSPEAYRYYSKGKNMLWIEGDRRKAIEFFEKAIAVDPEFAAAYMEMAKAYGVWGYPAKRREYLQKALELSDRMPAGELYRIRGTFYFQTEETLDKAIEAFNELLELYPDDIDGNHLLGYVYGRLEMWDKAIERYRVNVDNRIDSAPSYANLAGAYLAKGLKDKASEVLNDYINNIKNTELVRYHSGIIYLCQGKYELALAEADKAYTLNPNDYRPLRLKGEIYHCQGDFIIAEEEYQKLFERKEGSAKFWGRIRLSALCLSRGKYEESKIQQKKGIELAEEVNEKSWKSWFHSYLAYVYLKLGYPEMALEECNRAWNNAVEANSSYRKRRALHFKGLSYIDMELMDEARRAADQIEELFQNVANKKAVRSFNHLLGLIELKKDNYAKSIEYFEKVADLLPNEHGIGTDYNDHALYLDSLALAYYKAGEIEKSRENYERITNFITNRLFWGDIYAKSFYMLGKIYEQKGWEGKAIEHYEKFLDLWKDADPGIPELGDAKKRLAALKTQ